MSHFTKIDKANIVDVKAFASACEELGFTGIKFDVEITDYFGSKITVCVAVPIGRYDIALQKNSNDTYDMVADWWGVMREKLPSQIKNCRTEEDIQNLILKHTTKNTIVNNYRRQGYRASVREDEEENLHVELSRYR